MQAKFKLQSKLNKHKNFIKTNNIKIICKQEGIYERNKKV